MDRQKKPAVASSIMVTKTPPLRPNSKSNAIKERLPQVRQTQIPTKKRVNQPVRNERAAEKTPPKKIVMGSNSNNNSANSGIPSNVDPFEASEILRRELHREFGEFEDEKEPDLQWMSHLDELNNQLTEKMEEASKIDTSFVATFNEATKDFKPGDGNMFDSADKMMEIGFNAVNDKLKETRNLIDQRLDIIQQMMNEMQIHGVEEFKADLKLDDNPNVDPDPSLETSSLPKAPIGVRKSAPRNRK